jgi:succinoglycan biosynthesis protein ExoM
VRTVAICIVTYQRPVWLSALLESLAQLSVADRSEDTPLVVIVDNDGGASGRGAVERASEQLPFPVIYELEARRGISYARNRAVAVALAQGAEFVAFIDDDEIVSPGWLDEMLTVQRAYAADVVTGPVIPRFNDGVPDWIVRGRFFERPRFATGTLRRGGATNNCLISRRLFAGSAEPFDARFATSGGSDMHFFKRVARAGARIVWADRAVVEEWVPQSRARVPWLLQRAYRGGNAFTLSERILDRSGKWLLRRTGKGLARTIQGTLLVLPSIFLGRAPTVRALQKAAIGAGTLAAIMGSRYEEYRAVHGR